MTVETADEFALVVTEVLVYADTVHYLAARLFPRVVDALRAGRPVWNEYRHAGKAPVIEIIWRDRAQLFAEYLQAKSKPDFCATLPWIGTRLKFRLAERLA